MMWKTERKVREFVEKYHLIRDGDILVAGISGGADSVCLFHLLLKLQGTIDFRFAAVHVNHGLRGEEADRDERFVEELCLANDIPYYGVHRNIKEIAAQQGLSMEEAGRKARYEAFGQVMGQQRGTKIVLAHHRDDQAETMLHHLARGTGISGLCGLKPVSGNRIRPLLCLERNEIEEYLKTCGAVWQTDSTNQDDEYTRNKIRHHVVSYLCQEINPRTVSHMAETARELWEAEELLCCLTEEKAGQFTERHSTYGILSEKLRNEPGILQRRIILEEMKRVAQTARDFTRIHAEDVESLWEKQPGKKIMLPCGVTAYRGYDEIRIVREESRNSGTKRHRPEEERQGKERNRHIFLIPKEEKKEVIVDGYSVTYQIIPHKFVQIQEKKYTKWLDYDKIKDNVEMRHRNPGDRISILPSGGSKKLKDYLIDRKIPQGERDGLWLLADGQDILWIIGDRISEKYKVTDATRLILHIQIKGGTIHE